VAVALFVSIENQMTGVAFVNFGGLLKAGHATQPRCLGASNDSNEAGQGLLNLIEQP
jgi:hypothetical protein